MRETWRTHTHLLGSEIIASDAALTVMVLYRMNRFGASLHHDLVQGMRRLADKLEETGGDVWTAT